MPCEYQNTDSKSHNLWVPIEHLRQSIANKECVHILALFKHENDIKRTPLDKWASMICCNESYIEAITTDEILNSHIEAIRISKKNYKKYYDYLYEDFLNEICDMKKYQLYILLGIFKLIEKQGMKLEIIDEN